MPDMQICEAGMIWLQFTLWSWNDVWGHFSENDATYV